MTVFEKIEQLQEGRENTAPWMVGEQLKDICRRKPQYESIIMEDLENPAMGLEECEKQIKAWADKNKQGRSCVCVPPKVAEEIIRKFYGLGEAEPEQKAEQPKSASILDLEDLLGDL